MDFKNSGKGQEFRIHLLGIAKIQTGVGKEPGVVAKYQPFISQDSGKKCF